MSNKEIARLKAAVADLVGGIQQLHRQRADLDHQAAALYRAGRHSGLQVKFAKEIIQSLHGEAASVDAIWKLYAKKTGIDENAAADVSVLDSILGHPA
jgi:hypothetical protein